MLRPLKRHTLEHFQVVRLFVMIECMRATGIDGYRMLAVRGTDYIFRIVHLIIKPRGEDSTNIIKLKALSLIGWELTLIRRYFNGIMYVPQKNRSDALTSYGVVNNYEGVAYK